MKRGRSLASPATNCVTKMSGIAGPESAERAIGKITAFAPGEGEIMPLSERP